MNELKSTDYKLSNDPIIRFCALYTILYLGSLILGGYGIFSIVFGLSIFATRVLIQTPVGQLNIRRLFGFKFKQPDQIVNQHRSFIYQILTTSIRLIVIGFYTIVSVLLIGMGIKFMLNDGFLNQNLIYLLFFKFK